MDNNVHLPFDVAARLRAANKMRSNPTSPTDTASNNTDKLAMAGQALGQSTIFQAVAK